MEDTGWRTQSGGHRVELVVLMELSCFSLCRYSLWVCGAGLRVGRVCMPSVDHKRFGSGACGRFDLQES